MEEANEEKAEEEGRKEEEKKEGEGDRESATLVCVNNVGNLHFLW